MDDKLRQELIEVLEMVEWSSTGDYFYYCYCPCCGASNHKGHKKDCRLKALLDKLIGAKDAG
ncbi:MAG: hypothetical protein EHM79_00245 [Geobacter sp.]|nr:MAG: hypothetical protein EHM79_00245 [Geobacter sp.]